MKVSRSGDFFIASAGKWLFANTYSETVQDTRQYLATVTIRHHKPLFLNKFNNFDAKE
jgi:surface antigen